jgi:hypothetical protein
MNIWTVIIVIAVISIALSIVALKKLEDKSHLKHVEKKLFKGRVVFQDHSSEEESLSSSEQSL